VILGNLNLWVDPVARPGPQAMAVDEWLLETSAVPVLRVYRWLGDWGSLGYFGKLAEAKTAIPGLPWVRRWTGGGMVDHRADWTYSVIIPATEPLARLRGAGSYLALHSELASVLAEEGMEVGLSSGGAETGAALCFENPVSHDLVGSAGLKLAGAGQRRNSRGILHQGSVSGSCDESVSGCRAEALAGRLCVDWRREQYEPSSEWLIAKLALRYESSQWLERR
jgi:lipoyl(octanoyl) transferase